jgi:hypothetical protein
MANRAYVGVWAKGFREENMLDLFAQLLKTVPFSAQQPGIAELVIRAVDSTEAPLLERDLRSRPLDPAEVAEMAKEHQYSDSAYEIQTHWDLWSYDVGRGRWELAPQLLRITCHGEEYDDGVYTEAGHFQADIGFEHLFTGHGRLLGLYPESMPAAQHPVEAEFLVWMAQPENLREYHQKTRENIRTLLDWLRTIEEQFPVERYRLWSEGEENFEARLDEILAVR